MCPTFVDLIDLLLQVEPTDRLGCPGTDHDMRKLMRHKFFKGINFKSNLVKTTDVRSKLLDLMESKVDRSQFEAFPNHERFTIKRDRGEPVLQGALLKKNEWFIKQERLF